MGDYKSFLNDVTQHKAAPTQEQIDRCLANAEHHKQLEAAKPVKTPRARKPITIQQRQARLAAKVQKRATKHGLTVEQWWKQAETYYTIDPQTFTVSSVARSPNKPPRTWVKPDMISAEEKVYQLVGNYKYYDHFDRTNRPLSDFAY